MVAYTTPNPLLQECKVKPEEDLQAADYAIIGIHFLITVAVGLWVSDPR